MSKVKVTYVGEYSGIQIPELEVVCKRGESFEAPEEWARERVKKEPDRWKMSSSSARKPKESEQHSSQEDKD
jgi:hypothetical protein